MLTNWIIAMFAAFGVAQLANGQSTWSGAGTDLNWSTAGNWTGGVPGSLSTVTFPDLTSPASTNAAGLVNNIASSSTSIASLTYNNANTRFNTTLIPVGVTLTISGGLSSGANDGAGSNTVVTITGGGSLIAGTNGTSTWAGQNGSGQGPTSVLDMSGLTNFVFNYGAASPGGINLGTLSAGSSIQVSLAAASNHITAGTFNLANNNTRGSVTVNMGNGTNIIYADTINMGFSKTVGTLQFLNNAGGGLTIANHTGTGRATLNISGQGNSGGTTAANNGFMLFNGGTVNILGSTLTLGNRVGRAGNSANGVLTFDAGTVDLTTVLMALNIAPTSAGVNPANGTISVGNTGVLKVGTGGISLVNQAGTPGAGTLIITNGGTVICSNNIYKTTSVGTGTLAMDGGNLIMASIAGSIGVSNANPIDFIGMTNSTLTLPVAATANIVALNFNPDATTNNTINVSALPSISSYPAQFPVISYTTPGGNLDSLKLGSIPSAFSGYISNNVGNLSIDLVVTNGPAAKADQWGGGINNLWDTTTLNWTNSGVAVAYLDLDFVTFDDAARTNIVNLTGTRFPATLSFNNSVLNYTLNGVGKISGPVALMKDGTASVTLAETGGDNFSGGITVNNGTLVLDNPNSAILGGLTIAGSGTVQIGNNDANGAIPSGTLNNDGTLIFKRSNNVLVGVALPGGGGLTQNGSGTLSLSANNGYTGNTVVSAGTLALTNAGAIASSPQVSVTSATLDTSGVTTSATLQNVNLTNANLNVKVGYLQTNLNVASLTMGGAGNIINVRSLPPIAHYPATVTLLQSANAMVGYNFTLGSLPAATPSYAGTIAQSGDQLSVLLTLTAGPIGARPSVTWSGVDAWSNVNTNWSDALNWQTPGVPAATERVTFNDTATSGNTPFNAVGAGPGGIISPGNINNIVDTSLTNAGLSYANSGGSFHNTQISAGRTLTENGSVSVTGSGGNATVLGPGALQINNPANATVVTIANGTAPTLDMSGLDSMVATANQFAIGFNPASTGTRVNGSWYLARTNRITTGSGFSGLSAALVVGGSSGTTAGTGQLYLGQTNAIYVDGIVLGPGASVGDLITFNTAYANPVAYIRGITGESSRVTSWSLGDRTINLNNALGGNGHVNDFTAGTLNAMVATLIVGQGAQGNTLNTAVMGTFNMGAGILDVTSLKIGVSGTANGGSGIGIMNVTGGTVVADTLTLAQIGGGQGSTAGTLSLTNATLVVSNGVSIGAGTAGATLNESGSSIKLLNATTLGSVTPLLALNLDGGSFQLNVDANAGAPVIAATTVNTGAVTTINIGSIANAGGPVQIPLLSYTGNDPFGALSLGTHPAAYIVSLVDNTANSSVDLSIAPNAPLITFIGISGPTLHIQGINGSHGGQYVLLGSTNVALPLNQWTPILTNNYALDGSFNLTTNVVNPATPKAFYMLKQ